MVLIAMQECKSTNISIILLLQIAIVDPWLNSNCNHVLRWQILQNRKKKKQDIGNYCSACIHINILKEPLTPSPPNTNKKLNHQPRAMYKGYKRPRLLFSHTYLYVFIFYNFIKKKMALVTWCLIQLWEKNNQSNLTHGISVLSWHISNDYKQKNL